MYKFAALPALIGLAVLSSCTSTKPPNPQQKAEFDRIEKQHREEFSEIYGKEITRTGKPIPFPSQHPTDPPACKKLVERQRNMLLSRTTILKMDLTGLRAWGFFYYDVLPNGTTSNIRLISSSGGTVTDAEFKNSISTWTYQPSAGAKNCVAEMKIT